MISQVSRFVARIRDYYFPRRSTREESVAVHEELMRQSRGGTVPGYYRIAAYFEDPPKPGRPEIVDFYDFDAKQSRIRSIFDDAMRRSFYYDVDYGRVLRVEIRAFVPRASAENSRGSPPQEPDN